MQAVILVFAVLVGILSIGGGSNAGELRASGEKEKSYSQFSWAVILNLAAIFAAFSAGKWL